MLKGDNALTEWLALKMKWAIFKISNLFEYAAAAVVLLMMLHIVFDVLAKFVFTSPLPGTLIVVANYYMVAAVYLPLAFVELRKESIAVDLFYQWFPPSMKYLATLFGTLCSIVFFSILTYQSYGDAIKALSIGEFVDGTFLVITWPSRFFLPLSFGIVILVLLMRLIHEILHGEAPMTPPDKGLKSEFFSEGAE
ncbi:TRAP transporter small permease subunit [Thermodesulfobacteriota bacterium]